MPAIAQRTRPSGSRLTRAQTSHLDDDLSGRLSLRPDGQCYLTPHEPRLVADSGRTGACLAPFSSHIESRAPTPQAVSQKTARTRLLQPRLSREQAMSPAALEYPKFWEPGPKSIRASDRARPDERRKRHTQ